MDKVDCPSHPVFDFVDILSSVLTLNFVEYHSMTTLTDYLSFAVLHNVNYPSSSPLFNFVDLPASALTLNFVENSSLITVAY